MAQSVPTVRITRLPGSWRRPTDGLHPLRRPPVVRDPDAGGRGPRRRTPGRRRGRCGGRTGCRGRTGWRPGSTCAPLVGQPAARRRDADQQRVGPRDEAQRLVQRRDDRDVEAARVAEPLADVAAGLRGVDHRHDLVLAEADDAHGGLAVVVAEVALGEDHEAAFGGRRHGPIQRRVKGPGESRTSRGGPGGRAGRRAGGPGQRNAPGAGRGRRGGGAGTAYRIRTGGLRLERAVSWASRRMRRGAGRRARPVGQDSRHPPNPATGGADGRGPEGSSAARRAVEPAAAHG